MSEQVSKYNKKTVEDIEVSGKRVLLRCDFNVPQDKATREITDDKRITAALPTIRYLLEHGAAVIACSHLGKPKGEVKPELSLAPVAKRLGELLGMEVPLASDVVGQDAQAKAKALKPGEIMLLENLRFEKGEEKNDPAFAKALADLAEIYVSDAFGAVHRAHASTAGVADYLPAVSGFLIAKELEIMGGALENPKRPFVALMGGAKVSDKIMVLTNLLDKADTIIVGGGMAYTFLKSQGHEIGTSILEADRVEFARSIVEKAKEKGVRFLMSVDLAVHTDYEDSPDFITVDVSNIPENYMGMDIGPKTVELFTDAIRGAGTVVWNGPVGVFEFENFSKGTRAMARALAESGAVTIVGGGDSAAAVEQLGFADKITHISTGGGATLEFLGGEVLPGVACLLDKE